jgi:hypothetical protein
LIPDFGQTKYDDQILNLGPFEQQFNENFWKPTIQQGDLVYSEEWRQAHYIPKVIIDNPSSVDLLKVSGRTKTDWGRDLNAVRHLLQLKTETQRNKEEVEPLSNYNVLVLDQRFRKNSAVLSTLMLLETVVFATETSLL